MSAILHAGALLNDKARYGLEFPETLRPSALPDLAKANLHVDSDVGVLP